MTGTPASTDVDLNLAHEVALREFRRGRLRGCTPEQAVGWVTTGLLNEGLLTPTPAPRVLVDEADLRAVLYGTWQEHNDAHYRLRAALSAPTPGVEQ